VSKSAQYLSPSEAARRLGVSAKALRLYEQRGLVTPLRTAAGWRAYGPDQMARADGVVALRRLGLTLTQAARVLAGDPADLGAALAAHQTSLGRRLRDLEAAIGRVAALRAGLVAGEAPSPADLGAVAGRAPLAAFELPWPWGGERFELTDVRALTFIVGPLGSGKTRLARAIAQALPGATFVEIDRDGAAARTRLADDPDLSRRVADELAWLADEGATESEALLALVTALEAASAGPVVVDMVEQGLDRPSQEAVAGWLRRRADPLRPLFMLTRSSVILDFGEVGPETGVILCPANHAPPSRVAPHPGATGFEAVATCLAEPEVRARTEGMIAVRPTAA